ncbi:hypothetical protein A2U01_0025774, partial [Trifolium medium]|nr:hypothetical protein [Trifolium medium]
YLNGRECHYLKERDIAQKKANDLGLKLSEMKVSFDDYKNKDGLLVRVKGLEEKISGLEEKLKSAEVTLIGEEEEKADPAGIYVESSRAEMIAKIFEVESNMIETSSSQFHNASRDESGGFG